MRYRGVIVAAALVSCGDTGEQRVSVPLFTQGSAARELVMSGATFRLSRAQVAFGPLYVCRSENPSSELCELALLELTETVVIDALDPAETRAGELEGTSGRAMSALFDYGISYFRTQEAPEPAAQAPSGHSAVLEGEVERAGERVSFSAALDLAPIAPGESAVALELEPHRVRDGERLTVRIDPYAWLKHVDVDALFALSQRGKLRIGPGSQAYEALLQALQNQAPARLSFGEDEP